MGEVAPEPERERVEGEIQGDRGAGAQLAVRVLDGAGGEEVERAEGGREVGLVAGGV